MGSGAVQGVVKVCEDNQADAVAKEVEALTLYDRVKVWQNVGKNDLESAVNTSNDKGLKNLKKAFDNLSGKEQKKLEPEIKMVKEAADKMEEAYQVYLDWVKPVHEAAFDGKKIDVEEGEMSKEGHEMVEKFEKLLAEAVKCFDKDADEEFNTEEAGLFFTILVAANVDFEKKKTQQLNDLYMTRLKQMASKFQNEKIKNDMLERETKAQKQRAEEYEDNMKAKFVKYRKEKEERDREACKVCDNDCDGSLSIRELTRAITPYAGTNKDFFKAFGMWAS